MLVLALAAGLALGVGVHKTAKAVKHVAKKPVAAVQYAAAHTKAGVKAVVNYEKR